MGLYLSFFSWMPFFPCDCSSSSSSLGLPPPGAALLQLFPLQYRLSASCLSFSYLKGRADPHRAPKLGPAALPLLPLHLYQSSLFCIIRPSIWHLEESLRVFSSIICTDSGYSRGLLAHFDRACVMGSSSLDSSPRSAAGFLFLPVIVSKFGAGGSALVLDLRGLMCFLPPMAEAINYIVFS